MEREQRQSTIINLDDHDSRRGRVVIAIVAVLVAMLAIVPFVIDDTAPAESPGVTLLSGRSAPPTACRPSFDVPDMLDPLARIVLPGWTRLCGWLSDPEMVEPFDPLD